MKDNTNTEAAILKAAETLFKDDMLDKYRTGIRNMLTTAFARHDGKISASSQSGDTEVLPIFHVRASSPCIRRLSDNRRTQVPIR